MNNETHGGCSEYIQENSQEIMESMPELSSKFYIGSSEKMNIVGSNSVNLIVTSPPYPEVEMWEEEFGDYDEIHDMIGRVMRECWRVLDDGGIMCINVGDATRSRETFQCYPNHAEILVRGRELGFNTLVPIHWLKPTNRPNSFLGSGFMPPNAYTTLDTEYILVFRKGGTRENMPDYLRKASKFTKEQRDSWFSQQWKVPGSTQDGFAIFPNEVPYRLVRMFSILGDTVLDPFCGTGTTLQVARSLGRSAIGYEVNEGLRDEIEKKIDEVDSISNKSILENFVRAERVGEFGPSKFIENPNSLIGFL